MLRKAQVKDQDESGNTDLIFIMLGEMESEKDWSILMKDLIGMIIYWFWTFKKHYNLLTKLHF